jgi:hypothetical protein
MSCRLGIPPPPLLVFEKPDCMHLLEFMRCFISYSQFTAILLDGVMVAKSSKDKGILQVSLDIYINYHIFLLLILFFLCMGNQASVRRPRDDTKLVAMLNMRENPSVEHDNFFRNRFCYKNKQEFFVSY